MRVLYAWEIGDDLGHIRRFHPIARSLAQQGVDLSYALCDLSRSNFLRDSKSTRIYQAPCHPRSATVLRNNKSYPQLLFNHGFGDADAIAPRLAAWKLLLEHDQPDLVITDLAPVAQWAAQEKHIPVVNIGSGFECPPAASPMPMYVGASADSKSEAEADERKINAVIQTLCDREQMQPSSVQDIVGKVAGTILATYAPIDPYGSRPGVRYFGSWSNIQTEPNRDANNAQTVSTRPDIFCYLKYQTNIDFVIGSLAGLDLVTHVFMHGIPADMIDWFSAPNIEFLRSPANLHQVATTAKLAITHGNHGTTSFFLSKGIPTLMLPLHVEQWSHALRIQMSNLGRIIDLNRVPLFPRTVRTMLSDTSIHQAVQNFAAEASILPEPIQSATDQLLQLLNAV